MLCQLSDIGQDELVFQDRLHIALTQSVAWNAIRNGVLAHLHNVLTLSCSLACGTVRVPVELNNTRTFMACPSAGARMWTNVANLQMSSFNSASYLAADRAISLPANCSMATASANVDPFFWARRHKGTSVKLNVCQIAIRANTCIGCIPPAPFKVSGHTDLTLM